MLLLAEFVPPKDGEPEKRHIVSAFKLVQDLLAMPSSRGRNGFQLLVDILPPEHKARWLAGAALTAADQAMASVMSTVLSRLNAFLDTELEPVSYTHLGFTPTTRYCVRSWKRWRGTDRRIAGSSKRPAADGQLTTPFQNHCLLYTSRCV